ncbi:hypothetical protein PQ744_00595 [Thermoanaerobacterium thermosaccharolyticum]|uniref:hypothetical protein n=1 Tax=Thermoanaerobacterium thermosaccharolyticum TaxID=1517 RepID=UPI003D296CC4
MPQFFICYILLVITELKSAICTLTEGRPIVSKILPSSNYDREHILRIAASIKKWHYTSDCADNNEKSLRKL